MNVALALAAMLALSGGAPADAALDVDLRPPVCEEQVGDDGFNKVEVEHYGRNGRARVICIEYTSWVEDHSAHPNDVCLSCGAAPAEVDLAKPVCEEQVGDDGFNKVEVRHYGRNGKSRDICIDYTSWLDDHSNHPNDVCLSCDSAPAEIDLGKPVCEEQVGDDGFNKVLVDHVGRNGRTRTICIDYTSWLEDHSAHPDDTCLSCN